MKEQKFGVEVEFTGITRYEASVIVADYFGTRVINSGSRNFKVLDNQDRYWQIVHDGSIVPIYDETSGYDPLDYKVELVTPICEYNDIEDIVQIVRNLRSKEAKVHQSCAVHIHINGGIHTTKTLKNIVNIVASKEDLLYKALNVHDTREWDYCSKMNTDFLDNMNKAKLKSEEDIKKLWYEGYGDIEEEVAKNYSNTRYRGLNLHSFFNKGTIEFRLFNSTLNSKELVSYIHLCLAISNQALTQKSAQRAKTVTNNEKYTFRTWLLRLGFIGEEFKTTRHHLLKHLEGGIAWKDPAQQIAQKERLRDMAEIETFESIRNENLESDAQIIEENTHMLQM